MGSQLVTGAVFPQAVLVNKRGYNLVAIHEVGNNIAALHI